MWGTGGSEGWTAGVPSDPLVIYREGGRLGKGEESREEKEKSREETRREGVQGQGKR